ncbi:MAG: NAD(P)H-dependent oxidoreductase [Pseudomonadota bacterium]
MTTLIALSGALRAGSTNTLLAREAARVFGADQFALGDLNLPLYDGDLEAASGLPEGVTRLASQIQAADAVIISTPEYNGGIPGVLKNALDWISREEFKPFAGKPVAIMSAAAGRAGGARAQYALRLALVAFGPRIVNGPEVAVASSGKAFDSDGILQDEFAAKLLGQLMDSLKAEVARTA